MSDRKITASIFTPHATIGYQNCITENQIQYKETSASSLVHKLSFEIEGVGKHFFAKLKEGNISKQGRL